MNFDHQFDVPGHTPIIDNGHVWWKHVNGVPNIRWICANCGMHARYSRFEGPWDLDYEGNVWRSLGGYKGDIWHIDVRTMHCGEIVAMLVMNA